MRRSLSEKKKNLKAGKRNLKKTIFPRESFVEKKKFCSLFLIKNITAENFFPPQICPALQLTNRKLLKNITIWGAQVVSKISIPTPLLNGLLMAKEHYHSFLKKYTYISWKMMGNLMHYRSSNFCQNEWFRRKWLWWMVFPIKVHMSTYDWWMILTSSYVILLSPLSGEKYSYTMYTRSYHFLMQMTNKQKQF